MPLSAVVVSVAMAEVAWQMHITSCRALGDIHVAHVLEGDATPGIHATTIS